MKRTQAILTLAFLLLFAASLTPGQAPDFTGRWAGALATDEGPGGLEIALTRDGTTWKASAKVRLEGEDIALAVEDLKIKMTRSQRIPALSFTRAGAGGSSITPSLVDATSLSALTRSSPSLVNR